MITARDRRRIAARHRPCDGGVAVDNGCVKSPTTGCAPLCPGSTQSGTSSPPLYPIEAGNAESDDWLPGHYDTATTVFPMVAPDSTR